MIEKVECVMLTCDNCKKTFEAYTGYSIFVDESTIIQEAKESDWEINPESGNHYCNNCFYYDDNDILILKSQEKIVTFNCQKNIFIFNNTTSLMPPYKIHESLEAAEKHLVCRGIKEYKIIHESKRKNR